MLFLRLKKEVVEIVCIDCCRRMWIIYTVFRFNYYSCVMPNKAFIHYLHWVCYVIYFLCHFLSIILLFIHNLNKTLLC